MQFFTVVWDPPGKEKIAKWTSAPPAPYYYFGGFLLDRGSKNFRTGLKKHNFATSARGYPSPQPQSPPFHGSRSSREIKILVGVWALPLCPPQTSSAACFGLAYNHPWMLTTLGCPFLTLALCCCGLYYLLGLVWPRIAPTIFVHMALFYLFQKGNIQNI